jgi:hypothetical protein
MDNGMMKLFLREKEAAVSSLIFHVLHKVNQIGKKEL